LEKNVRHRFGKGYGDSPKDGVDAWLDKEKPCGEPRRTILPGQDWELEIRKTWASNKLQLISCGDAFEFVL
jgi:hypothetical protein